MLMTTIRKKRSDAHLNNRQFNTVTCSLKVNIVHTVERSINY